MSTEHALKKITMVLRRVIVSWLAGLDDGLGQLSGNCVWRARPTLAFTELMLKALFGDSKTRNH